jgi:predicted Fe-Mo cluster-binding NifX family protein
MRIAIPVTGGLISPHFARGEEFVLFDIEDGEVKNRVSVVPPGARSECHHRQRHGDASSNAVRPAGHQCRNRGGDRFPR